MQNESLRCMGSSHDELRRQIDRLRVRLWYAWMAHQSGAPGRAFEKRLWPKNFARTATATQSHRKRMERCAKGEHVPRRNLVQRAELEFPGSQALLDHVCWQVLNPTLELKLYQEGWIECLGTEVNRLLFEPTKKASAVHIAPTRRRATPGMLHKLERLASLDALAVTALLLREAELERRIAFAFECARSFWYLLLILGSTKPFTDNLKVLAKLSGNALLDQVEHRGQRVTIATAPIDIFEHALSAHCLESIDDEEAPPSQAQFVEEQLKALRGTTRPDIKYALQLPTVATSSLEANHERYAIFVRDQWIRRKALDYTYDRLYRNRSFVEDLAFYYRDPEKQWPLHQGSQP
jgi:hypothetical protein